MARELEIGAVAHITHLKTVVVPQGLDFEPSAYNTRERKVAVLWYTASHVDLALPLDGGKEYPEAYRKVVQGPTGNLRAGGRASDCASAPLASLLALWFQAPVWEAVLAPR